MELPDLKTLSESELLTLYERLISKRQEIVHEISVIENLKSKLADKQFKMPTRRSRTPRTHTTRPDFSHNCRPRFDRI